MEKLFALYKLTRVGTIMDSFPFLMTFAIIASRLTISWTVVFAVVTNLLLLVFAYMINDIADAEDDKHDPHKRDRNPVAAGKLTYLEANIATILAVGVSIMFLVSFGMNVLLVGISILVLGFLYSWNPVRLKANPLVDIISHGYFLAAAQILFFALLPGATFDGLSLAMAAGVYIFSIGGDLHNEVRDWDVDQKAGLHNTANLLGFNGARAITFGFWSLGVILIVASTLAILLPRLLG